MAQKTESLLQTSWIDMVSSTEVGNNAERDGSITWIQKLKRISETLMRKKYCSIPIKTLGISGQR